MSNNIKYCQTLNTINIPNNCMGEVLGKQHIHFNRLQQKYYKVNISYNKNITKKDHTLFTLYGITDQVYLATIDLLNKVKYIQSKKLKNIEKNQTNESNAINPYNDNSYINEYQYSSSNDNSDYKNKFSIKPNEEFIYKFPPLPSSPRNKSKRFEWPIDYC